VKAVPSLFSVCAVLLSCVATAPAIAAELQANSSGTAEGIHITPGQSVYPLNGPWKFSIGDSPIDPATSRPLWAEPGFDDSRWETVDLTPKAGAIDPFAGFTGYVPGWTSTGHPGYSGYAWYRIHVHVDVPSTLKPGQKPQDLALSGPASVDDGYQLFANGTLLGAFGDFSGRHPLIYYSRPMFFPVPQPSRAAAGSEVLAFRVWMDASTLVQDPDSGGLHTAPLLGEAGAVHAGYQLSWLELFRGYVIEGVAALFFLLLAVAAYSLALFDRSDRVYLWIAAVFLVSTIQQAQSLLSVWSQYVDTQTADVLQDVLLDPFVYALWSMVWWNWFRLQRTAWLPKAIGVLTVLFMLSTALGEDLFLSLTPSAVAAFHSVSLCVRFAFLALVILIVIFGIRRQGREGWVALPAVVLQGVAEFSPELAFLHIKQNWFPFGIGVRMGQAANLLLVGVLSTLLLRRLLLSVREQRRLALDVKQAQEVQQVILPEALMSYAGLTIESEYHPAREVGGDFFQIIPHPTDSSLLIVAGDVTGKGLQAGMLVALLVGAIRTAAQYDADPLAVLCTLNLRLLGRGSAAATCLALRIAADGTVKLANAGHLPPYLNAQPIAMEGALPLGMLEGAEFSVMHFQLQPGDKLLIVSDGISEATDANGSLFGFERIEQMLRNSASNADLIRAAQDFGQEDDISLIALTRTAVPEPALA
jgi:hypothetical protein